VSEGLWRGEVVDGDDLELTVSFECGAERIASDPSEAVDGDAGHGFPFVR
jgi:hypothetical protein